MTLPDTPVSAALIAAARELSARVSTLTFAPPVSHVYNPLTYAWAAHEAYLRRYAASPRRVVFLGMNPGPFGMVQNGVPFGDLAAVRDWLGIVAEVQKPATENPARPIEGFACARSEVSGRRLWGLFRERFGTPEVFFSEHFVANYCPLAFFAQGRNLTPDKLSLAEAMPLQAACDAHLKAMVSVLQPEWVIGVGAFAVGRAASGARRQRDEDRSGPPPEPGEPARQPGLG
jgi:single-strand selective monofunctional uracil DNA glycosylase